MRASLERATPRRAAARHSLVAALLGAVVLVLAVVLVVAFRTPEGSNRAAGTGRVGATGVPSTAVPSTPVPSTAAPSSPSLHVLGAGPAAPAAAAVEPPVRVRIPAIGVDSTLQRLGLLADGTLEPPTQWAVAGWYAGGVVPGQVGPAVIAGHVDSTKGPAVFYRLKDLVVGDRIRIDARGGQALTFQVDAVQRFTKKAFPTAAVYGAVPDPELRLVTCTGTFDRTARSYLDNLVVSAHLVAP